MNGATVACGYLNLVTSKNQYVSLSSLMGLIIGRLESFSFSGWINYRSYTDRPSRLVNNFLCSNVGTASVSYLEDIYGAAVLFTNRR